MEFLVLKIGISSFLYNAKLTHSSTLAWKIPWMEERGRLQSMGSQRVRHDWATSLSLSLPNYFPKSVQFSSVTQSCPTLCDSMYCSTPGFFVHHHLPELTQTHIHPTGWWCHTIISSSVAPFSFCLQSFPASGSFPMSQFFPSGDQSIGASALVLPMNIQDWFPLRLSQSSY